MGISLFASILLSCLLKPFFLQQHSVVRVQMAALYCLSNLAEKMEKADATYQERHRKLKSIGACKILQQLKNSSDTALQDQ